jgi:hypothetical protein
VNGTQSLLIVLVDFAGDGEDRPHDVARITALVQTS